MFVTYNVQLILANIVIPPNQTESRFLYKEAGVVVRLTMAEPVAASAPAPESGLSSWFSKVKTIVTPVITSDTVAPPTSAVPSQPVDESVTVSVAPSDAPVTAPTGTGDKPWTSVKSLWKKAVEIGADVIRLDPPEHAQTVPPSGAGKATLPSNSGASAPVAPPVPADSNVNGPDDDSEMVSESAGLLGGRLKVSLPTDRVKSLFTKSVSSVKAVIPAQLGGTPSTTPPEPDETFWGLSRCVALC